METEAPEKISI